MLDVGSELILQLCRGASAFWSPVWGPSKLICASLRYLYKELGVRYVIAYADPQAGEIGTIYQACNAFYIGLTDPGRAKRYIINGHSYDPRKVHKKFGSRAHAHLAEIDPKYTAQKIEPKHRYIFVLGPRIQRAYAVKRMGDLIKPYPKRDVLYSNYM
jgi:hypothetical protein